MLTKNTRSQAATIHRETGARMILRELYRAHIRHTNSMTARKLHIAG
jgi:hypothetical protein